MGIVSHQKEYKYKNGWLIKFNDRVTLSENYDVAELFRLFFRTDTRDTNYINIKTKEEVKQTTGSSRSLIDFACLLNYYYPGLGLNPSGVARRFPFRIIGYSFRHCNTVGRLVYTGYTRENDNYIIERFQSIVGNRKRKK